MEPMFGTPIGPWHEKFLWFPTWTSDFGWKWLIFARRRLIQKHESLTGGGDFWFQYAIRPDFRLAQGQWGR